MTTRACPKCTRNLLRYRDNGRNWECIDCGHVWALDADDLADDDEEIDPWDYRNRCSTYDGSGSVESDGRTVRCYRCGGSGTCY
ncbi:MAG: hypothetical protein V7K24_21215 [Nostoc sp.]